MKPGIVALVPDQWGGPWMPRHQVLLRLSRRAPVVWVDRPDVWQQQLRRRLRPDDAVYDVPLTYDDFRIYRASRFLGEYFRPTWLVRQVRRARLAQAVRWLKRRGCDRFVLYVWRPEFAYALGEFPWDASVYHIDDEYSFAEDAGDLSADERQLIEQADQVIVHSPGLMERKGGINPRTAQIPNGVDYAAFAEPRPEPADLAAIPRPRVGYVGVIKKQLDLDLLARLAERHPAYSFVLVGPVLHVREIGGVVERLQRLANVHFLGPRKPTELPDYVQHLDVGLLCYRVTAYTNCIYPLKLHEYLAAGIPTVGSPIRSLLEYTEVVSLAENDAEWSAALARAVQPQSQEARERRRAVAAAHDWDEITERVWALMLERLADGRSGVRARA